MNVFYLDKDPKTAARMHCDKHANKMLIEYAQMLCTTHREFAGVETFVDGVYCSYNGIYRLFKKPRNIKVLYYESVKTEVFLTSPVRIAHLNMYMQTHLNHPCNKWLRESYQNYYWLWTCMRELAEVYTEATGKMHATHRNIFAFVDSPPAGMPVTNFTDPPACMPDEYKLSDSVSSYRNLYMTGKRHMVTWKRNPQPAWFN